MDYSKRRPMSDALRTAKLSEEALNFLNGTAAQPPAAAAPVEAATVLGAGRYRAGTESTDSASASNHYADKIIAASLGCACRPSSR